MKASLHQLAAVAQAALDRTPLKIACADWNPLLKAAEEHGMTVMLARGLAEADVPAVVRERLSREAGVRMDRAVQITRQLRRLVDDFRAQDIPFLAVKGPVLAATAYGDVTLRGASLDLDLVVRKTDLSRAIHCMEAAGYRRLEPAIDDHDHEQWESEAHLFPEDAGVMVELHTDLIGSFHTEAMDLEAVFGRTAEQILFGTPVRVLAPEDLLLYLALHAARHFWSRLLWICDLGALIRTMPVDWEVVAARAGAINARRRLAVGLALTERLTGTAAPGKLTKVGGAGLLTALAIDRMERTSRGVRQMGLFMRFVHELTSRETGRQRQIYLKKQLTPNARDRAWISLPRGLDWLRYVIRPVRLLLSYGKISVRGRQD